MLIKNIRKTRNKSVVGGYNFYSYNDAELFKNKVFNSADVVSEEIDKYGCENVSLFAGTSGVRAGETGVDYPHKRIVKLGDHFHNKKFLKLLQRKYSKVLSNLYDLRIKSGHEYNQVLYEINAIFNSDFDYMRNVQGLAELIHAVGQNMHDDFNYSEGEPIQKGE